MKHEIFNNIRNEVADNIKKLTENIKIDTTTVDSCEPTAEANVNLMRILIRDIRAQLRKEQMLLRKAKSSAEVQSVVGNPHVSPPATDTGMSGKTLNEILPQLKPAPTVQRVIQRRRSALTLESNKTECSSFHEDRVTDTTSDIREKPIKPGVRRTISNVQSAVSLSVSQPISTAGGALKPKLSINRNNTNQSKSSQVSNPDTVIQALPQPPTTLSVLAKGRFIRPHERKPYVPSGPVTVRAPNGKLEVVIEEDRPKGSGVKRYYRIQPGRKSSQNLSKVMNDKTKTNPITNKIIGNEKRRASAGASASSLDGIGVGGGGIYKISSPVNSKRASIHTPSSLKTQTQIQPSSISTGLSSTRSSKTNIHSPHPPSSPDSEGVVQRANSLRETSSKVAIVKKNSILVAP